MEHKGNNSVRPGMFLEDGIHRVYSDSSHEDDFIAIVYVRDGKEVSVWIPPGQLHG